MIHSAIRTLVVASISLCALALQAAPAAAKETPKKSVVLMVAPFSVDADPYAWIGLGAAEELLDLQAQQNTGAWVATKQLDAALRRKDLRLEDATDLDVALPLARTLGATDLIIGQAYISEADKTVTVRAQRYGVVAKALLRQAEAKGSVIRLPALLEQLAVQLLDVPPTAVPMTDSATALAQGAECLAELVHYPLQPRAGNPPPLEKINAVDASCQNAVHADFHFGIAHAGSAIVKSLRGEAVAGRDELAKSRYDRTFDAWLSIADSFAARRAGDAPAAHKALEDALQQRPGFLLAAGYLAEERMEAGDYKGAAEAWDRFLKRAPSHPYALGQKGKALGYLHKDREALALTRQALDINPGDPELLVELGSRQVDAKQFPEAEATLRQAMEARPPRPLAWLRMGYLYMQENKPKEAHDALIEAVTYAYRDDEGRTRASIFADLALVEGMQGHVNEAVQYLQQAKSEGYGKLPCDAAQLQSLKGKPAYDALCSAN